MEAMDYETVRCGPLMTKEFVDHIKLRQQTYASRGPAGEEPLVELQALEEWVMVARERQSERDDNARRAKAIEANGIAEFQRVVRAPPCFQEPGAAS